MKAANTNEPMDKNIKVNLWVALIPIVFLVGSLAVTLIKFGGEAHIPLLLSTAVAAIVALIIGFKWDFLEKSIIQSISIAMQAILILMVIGVIIGTWIAGGVVPTMIYYGLDLLSPAFFLVTTCLLCAIVSFATGSAWTTAGTVGIAVLGIGQGLGIPMAMIAGAVISGAYFGDKMSPLSDTTNLAPAIVGVNLYKHIGHMIYTTGPALIIALIIYGVLGMRFANQAVDTEQIQLIKTVLSESFLINPWLFIPPLVVILLVVLKMPALPGMMIGGLLGSVFHVFVQGGTFGDTVNAMYAGFSSETGVEMIDSLLTRGGLEGMMYTISLIIIAMSFGGIMEKTGMLQAIMEKLISLTKSTGNLIATTVGACVLSNAIAADQYLSHVIPGKMFAEKYKEKKLELKNLSRTLEDAGTMTSSFFPWNTCGAFMMTTLAVHPFEYAPYAFLNILSPVIAIVFGYLGITIAKEKDQEPTLQGIDERKAENL
ncbi:Na+/H+ antiporter NhaC [Bacillus freudenreichii]|nr:Na+/H+ antiporter NhaC [Bacillus freudenreichii]